MKARLPGQKNPRDVVMELTSIKVLCDVTECSTFYEMEMYLTMIHRRKLAIQKRGLVQLAVILDHALLEN